MTRKELRLALRQMEDRGAHSLRLFLDNRTIVLAHYWFLEEGQEGEGEGEGGSDGEGGDEDGHGGDNEGLLRVVVRGRQALIAVSRIAVIEMVPRP